MREIGFYLTNFIDPDDDFKTILTIESVEYLPEIVKKFPRARIFAVLSDESKIREEFQIEWKILEYRETPLPFRKEYFDLIISDLTFEVVGNPQDIAVGISSFIKKTGFLITSFRNIRHWEILKNLMHGKYSGIISRLYSRGGFEQLLYASFFKHTRFAPIRRLPEKKDDKKIFKKLIDCGFENRDDLETEFWIVRAARSMPELALLKSMYTYDLRQEFAFILHRIEYEVETEASVRQFWKFFRDHKMFVDYAALFIHEAVIHRPRFYETLYKFSQSEPELRELLKTAEDVEASFE